MRFKEYLAENDIKYGKKDWAAIGAKATERMKAEKSHWFYGHPETTHDEIARTNLEDHIKLGDPTKNLSYGKWIASRYANGGINRLEDISGRVNDALTKFHTNKHQLAKHGIDPNINAHKSLSHLEDAMDKIPHEKLSTSAPKDTIASEADHYEDEHWKIKVPHTQEASQHYGQGTRWCTAGTKNCRFHEYYTKTDPLHIFIPKRPIYPGEKYQLHVGTDQFMDEKDSPVHLSGPFATRPSKYLHDLITRNL